MAARRVFLPLQFQAAKEYEFGKRTWVLACDIWMF